MQVREQNDVDFFRRVACAAEAARQAPERSATPPGARACIDEDHLLACVDQEAHINNIQHVRIFLVNTGKRSEEHTSELQSRQYLVCRLLLEKKKQERDTA